MVIAEGGGNTSSVLYAMHPSLDFPSWSFPPDFDYDKDTQIDSNADLLPFYGPYNNVGVRHNKRAACVYADGHADFRHIRDLVVNADDLWGTRVGH